MLIKLIRTY